MRTADKFPWEFLKAECLRLVCVQLVEGSGEGHNSFKPGRKDEMIAFLQDVHARGVLKALQDVEPPKTPKRPASSVQQATPSKRKSSVDMDEDADGETDNEGEEGYNTRFKGVKRVKVHGPSPEPPEPKPRRKVSRVRKSVLGGSPLDSPKRGRPRKDVLSPDGVIKVSRSKGKPLENDEAIPSISRGRGRPRKNENGIGGVSKPDKTRRQSTNANAPKSKDGGREVFDGILLVKRRRNGKDNGIGGGGGGVRDDDVERPMGNNEEGDGSEEDAVLAAVNGDGQGDLSSLGGSNKENEMSYNFGEGHYEGDMDADGEFEADAEV